MNMFSCVVCGAKESSDEVVDEVFCVGGQYVLVWEIQLSYAPGAASNPLARNRRKGSG